MMKSGKISAFLEIYLRRDCDADFHMDISIHVETYAKDSSPFFHGWLKKIIGAVRLWESFGWSQRGNTIISDYTSPYIHKDL